MSSIYSFAPSLMVSLSLICFPCNSAFRIALAQLHPSPYPVGNEPPEAGEDAPASVDDADVAAAVDCFHNAVRHILRGHQHREM